MGTDEAGKLRHLVATGLRACNLVAGGEAGEAADPEVEPDRSSGVGVLRSVSGSSA